MQLLFVFVNDHSTFRLPELESVAKLLNVKLSYTGPFEEDVREFAILTR